MLLQDNFGSSNRPRGVVADERAYVILGRVSSKEFQHHSLLIAAPFNNPRGLIFRRRLSSLKNKPHPIPIR